MFNCEVFHICRLLKLSTRVLFSVLQLVLCTADSQSVASTENQVGKLLDMMGRRSAKAFDALIEALVLTDQEHAAEVLDRNKTAELVRKRDAERTGNHSVMQASSSGFTSPSAMVPSGSTVVSTSSSATHVPSSHANAVPSSCGQGQFAPSGMYCWTFMYL